MQTTISDFYATPPLPQNAAKGIHGKLKRMHEASNALAYIAETGGRTKKPAKHLIDWESPHYLVWKADSQFATKQITNLPQDVAAALWNQYVSRWEKYINKSGQSRSANIWLRKRVAMITNAVGKLPVHIDQISNEVRRQSLAESLANQCYDLMVTGAEQGATAEIIHKEISQIAERWGYVVSLPAQRLIRLENETLEEHAARADEHFKLAAIARMITAEWWERKLEITHRRFCEHCRIMLGKVRKGVSAYLSEKAKRQFKERQISSRLALSQMLARNEITEEEVELLQAVDASISNPENRRVELMVRLRGFETVAEENGMMAGFITTTCPSRFHAFKTGRKGEVFPNSKYAGTTPRDAQKHLTDTWARLRSFLGRRKIPIMGFRICEPHHDATPHWHMLLFFKPEHEHIITWAFAKYFSEKDRDELNLTDEDFRKSAVAVSRASTMSIMPTKKWMKQFEKQTKGMSEKDIAEYWATFHDHCDEAFATVRKRVKARMEYVPIDPERGSATGYIAKYISKNIDGHKVELDEESGEAASDSATAVVGWASEWGIRQFQQVGGPSVTVWRELRRLETDTEKENRLAAKKENRPYTLEMAPWNEVQAVHDAMEQARLAACASRWDMYIDAMGGPFAKRDLRPVSIHYTFQENKIGEDVKKVRGVQHLLNVIETRKEGWVITKKGSCSGSKAFGQGDSRAAWSSINNCTERSKNDLNEAERAVIDHLAATGRDISERELREICAGRPVTQANGERLKLRQTENGISLDISIPQHQSGAFLLPPNFKLSDINTPPPPQPAPGADIDPSREYWERRKP